MRLARIRARTCARVLTPLLLLVPLAGIAGAAPSAGQYEYLRGTVALQGTDGAAWRIRVAATQSGAFEVEQQHALYVNLDRCVGQTCTRVGTWSRPLAPSEVDVTDDLTKGTLATTLFGLPLRMSLTGRDGLFDTAGAYLGGAGIAVSATDPGAYPRAGRERGADGTMTVLGSRCAATSAALVQETYADVSVVDDAFAPPPRTALRALRGKLPCVRIA